MTNLSPHLTLEEFTYSLTAQKYCIDNSLPAALRPAADAFASWCFEELRSRLGALHVNSGYRCTGLDFMLVGARPTMSQHAKANAVDFFPIAHGSAYLPGDLKVLVSDHSFHFDQLMLEGITESTPKGRWIHCSFNTDLTPEQQRHDIKIASIDAAGKTHYTSMTRDQALAWCDHALGS